MTDPSAPLEANSSQGDKTMAELSDDKVDAADTTVPAAASSSAKAGLQSLPAELLRIILADLYHAKSQPDRPDEDDDDESETSNESLLSAMRSCKKLCEVGRRVLYHAPVILIPHERKMPPDELAERRSVLTWQLYCTLRSSGSIAGMVTDSRHINSGLELSPPAQGGDHDDAALALHGEAGVGGADTPNTLSPPGEYTLEEAILEMCPSVVAAAVTLRSQEQAARIGQLLSYAPILQTLVVRRSQTPEASGHLSFPASESASTELDILARCLQPLAPALRSAAPPLVTLNTYVPEHECDPEICGVALMVRKVARTLEVRTVGHTQLLCYSMPRRSFLHNPDLPRVTSVVISITDGQQSVDFNQLAHDLDGNILKVFVIDLAVGAFDEDPWWDNLQDYGSEDVRYPRFSYSDQCYRLFPHARKLCLPRGRDMVLSKLSALVDTSPNLEYLNLAGTEWSIGVDALAVEQPGDLSSFEQDLVQILERLAHLSYIHLGHWPFINADGTDAKHGRLGLAAWARNRGIELLVAGCAPNPEWP